MAPNPLGRPLHRRDFLKAGMISTAAFAAGRFPPEGPAELRLYLGTYTEGTGSEGIYHALLDPVTGALRVERVTGGARNPSFLALHPDGRTLYSVEEVDDLDGGGGVVAYAVDAASGALRERSRARSGGAHPAHLAVDAARDRVLVANYSGATVAVLELDPAGAVAGPPRVVRHQGSGPLRARQDAPHPHSVYPVGGRVYAADLGLDRVFAYGWSGGAERLVPQPDASLSLPPGSGPRHVAFHPARPFAYVINELASTITAARLDAGSGALRAVQTVSALPRGYRGESYCADVHVHPGGRWLYGSNRGHDSIVVAEISPEDGTLEVVQHHSTGGSWPRSFALDPAGRFLLVANQRSDSVVTLAVDPATGRLSGTGRALPVPAPVCVRFATPP